uniref:Uncharacterized protein n=1 Tax=Ditylenchus dipsaci TaxID=166011 RepID=A0A915E9B0_9BILA
MLIALLCFCLLAAGGVAEQGAVKEMAKGTLGKAVEAAASPGTEQGQQIRECSCQESKQCLQEMNDQAIACFEGCFDKSSEVKSMTNQPAQFKTCFKPGERVLAQFLGCLEEDPKTCIQDKNGPMIPRRDVHKVIEEAHKKLEQEIQTFEQTLSKEGTELIKMGRSVGRCVKQCFFEKNQGGFCFDKIGCQPKVEQQSVGSTVELCSSRIDWGTQVRQVCDCSAQKGVEKVKPFCEAIKTLSGES